jgi:SAM-dependent methyltransferase
LEAHIKGKTITTGFNPIFRINSKPFAGRIRILTRLLRFALVSLRRRHFDFFANAVSSILDLLRATAKDAFSGHSVVRCNICGWTGNSFYRHTGPGYDEKNSLCPGCLCQDRHRALLVILEKCTDFFSPGKKIVEVAPERNLEMLYINEGLDYTSFDIKRRAMEQGDITRMRYSDNSIDYFLCLHVLEHVPGEKDALREMYRVLKPGGCAIVQVPVDWNLSQSYEYPMADPRDTFHVRRYGSDFVKRITLPGFEVASRNINDCLSIEDVNRFGCSREPVFFLKKASSV